MPEGVTPELVRCEEDTAQALLTEGVQWLKEHGVPAEGQLVYGDPLVHIPEVAQRIGADLIVVGYRYRSAYGAMVERGRGNDAAEQGHLQHPRRDGAAARRERERRIRRRRRAGAGERRLMITFAVMSATLIQVLDTTIVNVALPHMQGELGTTSDQISWVLTSYLVSSAIFMPLTGYFADVWGRKRFLLVSIAGFVAASALCGISQSLAQIVLFRLLQGVFGAALVPLSQAIMADAYPPHERGRAMAIWGFGVMVGPVAGPDARRLADRGRELALDVLHQSARRPAVAVPRGAVRAGFGAPRAPHGLVRLRLPGHRHRRIAVRARSRQSAGLVRGGRHPGCGALLAVVGLAVVHRSQPAPARAPSSTSASSRDRNFGMSSLVMACMGLGMFGGLVLQPILLEGLLGYPIVTTGVCHGAARHRHRHHHDRRRPVVVARRCAIPGAHRLVFERRWARTAMTYYSLDVTQIEHRVAGVPAGHRSRADVRAAVDGGVRDAGVAGWPKPPACSASCARSVRPSAFRSSRRC